MFHPLMDEAISESDFSELINFLKEKPRVTSGKKVLEFEKAWSSWNNVKFSVMVNSGSSANIITWRALKILNEKKGIKKNKVLLSPLTWVSDIVALYYAGFKAEFVDINLRNLSIDYSKISEDLWENSFGIFPTHVLGLNSLTDDLISNVERYKLTLIEDCCEAHGATFKNKKVGSFGFASNFSFYFAHHLTTVEGGMVCTNDEEFYHLLLTLRSHGMLRENPDRVYQDRVAKNYPDLHPEFIFENMGFNFRSNELSAVLGLSQLNSLDNNIKKRNENFIFFLEAINDCFYKNFSIEGQSNYAFILILKKEFRNKFPLLLKALDENKIEYRRGLSGGGNQLKQPYIKQIGKYNPQDYPNIEYIHQHSLYLGNYPSLDKEKIQKIANIINLALG